MEQLSAYLDGELSQAESCRVAEMVAADPALSAELESLRAVQSLLRGLPPARAPAGMADAVLERAQRKSAGWWAGYLARAAVILLAVGVGVTVTTWLNRPTRPQQTGQQTPDVAKPPILAKGAIAEVGGLARAEVTNVFINTDNLLLTQREVERVFGNNSIKPMVAAESVRVAKVAHDKPRGRANFYNQTQVAPTQIRYEVVIEENQMRQIVSELNEVRARQNVAQMPMRRYGYRKDGEAIALAKADDRSGYAAGRGRASRDAIHRKSADKKRFSENARLKPSVGKVAEVRGQKVASQPALASATPRPGTVRSRSAMPKPPAGPTTMPASTVVAQRKTKETLDPKVARRQAATQATANVRQLVVILNVVGE